MKSPTRTSVFLLLMVVASQTSSSQQMHARFLNSTTGAVVIPSHVFINDGRIDKRRDVVAENVIEPTGRGTIGLSRGPHTIVVYAEGYKSLSANVVLEDGENLSVEFHLDPVVEPSLLRSESVQMLHRPDATVAVGHIIDDATGKPLPDVSITSMRGGATAKTDASGFFSIYIPIAATPELAQQIPALAFGKAGYTTIERRYIDVWPNGDVIYRIRMKHGSGKEAIDERTIRRRPEENPADCVDCNKTENSPPTREETISVPPPAPLAAAVVLPNSIRVGRNCPSSTTCTTVEVYTLERYCKGVLPAEVYSCWGSLANGMNSLKAFAVPVRSYGTWYVYNPITANYDICSTTSCQVFGDVTSSNTNNAVDQTARYVIASTGGAILRAEYSAENNNNGCGNGYSGTGSSWPCIWDSVCINQADNGHGRGMCQYGSVRWATGTIVTTTSPCALGTAHTYGPQDWTWIVAHYYPGYVMGQGATASITNATPVPDSVPPAGLIAINYPVSATDAMTVMLGASIAPTGSSSWSSNAANDLKVNLPAGASVPSRNFRVDTTAAPGSYDLLASLWYDRNNNNVIDSPPDFLVTSQQYSRALTVTALPVQLVSFTALGLTGNRVRLDWRTISEINNLGFTIQRRRSVETIFREIPGAFVRGHGTTLETHDYSYTDTTSGAGVWWYRLRQIDFDSSSHYSGAIQVSIPNSVASSQQARSFSLGQNYPNPFNPSTTIRFQIGDYGWVTLRVYDLLGREVSTLVDERLASGSYTVTLDALNLPSGVYYYRLRSGAFVSVKKLLVVK